MGPSPDRDSRIADMQHQLDLVERISADIADDEIDDDSASAEQLRLTMQAIARGGRHRPARGPACSPGRNRPPSSPTRAASSCATSSAATGRRRSTFSPSTRSRKPTSVDVGKNHTTYSRTDTGTDYERARASWQASSSSTSSEDPHVDDGDTDNCLVWELFNKRDGLVYVICDGYPDFLKEPAAPDVYTDRFWPWFLTAFNEVDGKVYPPSDVSLIRPMQRELNRSRQGLREHRFANRPKMAYAEGTLSRGRHRGAAAPTRSTR